jgi:hypothetical protein
LTVFHQDGFDHAAGFSSDVIHHFHRFDDAQDATTFLHGPADLTNAGEAGPGVQVPTSVSALTGHSVLAIAVTSATGAVRRHLRSRCWSRCFWAYIGYVVGCLLCRLSRIMTLSPSHFQFIGMDSFQQFD